MVVTTMAVAAAAAAAAKAVYAAKAHVLSHVGVDILVGTLHDFTIIIRK